MGPSSGGTGTLTTVAAQYDISMARLLRYPDQVAPNTSDSIRTFSAISPALIFRAGWQAHDQVALQYSHWFNGANTNVLSPT
ncbi:MAG TPA: hypothetical protein VIK01_14710 [Polyangiaceae bacterium]